jgi:GntR family transcriptional regulator
MADPTWKKIAEDLRQKIEAGQLGQNREPLPTELELQAEYGASRNTVRDAIKWLVGRDMVYTRSGQGTFVKQRVDPFVTRLNAEGPGDLGDGSAAYASEVASRRRQAEVSAPRVESQRAYGVVAVQLQLPDGANVVSRHQRRFIDALPYSLQTTFYPLSLVELGATGLLLAEDIPDGAVSYIKDAVGIEEKGWRDLLTVRVPDSNEIAFFGLPDDGRIAVFEFIRTGYDSAGQPLRVTITTYPADRNQFVMVTGTVPGEPPDDA